MKRLAIAAVMSTAFGFFGVFAMAAPAMARPAMAGTPTDVTCGDTISAPGQYNLTADCSGTAITIAASNVHLKLNGHTISSSHDGIMAVGVTSPLTNIHVQGPGTIENSGYAGFELSNVDNSFVEGVTVLNSAHYGFALYQDSNDQFTANVVTDPGGHGFSLNTGSGNQFVSNVVSGFAGIGIYLYHTSGNHVVNNVLRGGTSPTSGNAIQLTMAPDNHVDGNQAIDNAADGIFVDNYVDTNDFPDASSSTGNSLDGNTVTGNATGGYPGAYDIVDVNPCGSNKWEGNQFGTANLACIS